MNIQIRKAEKKDLKDIYRLVRELAVYEKAEDQLIIDIPYYEREFEEGTFSAIVAEAQEQVIGICIYYLTYSTWKGRMMYLEDFVVDQRYRHQGVGQMLFDSFIQESKDQNCSMVKWQVYDWNEPAIKFYEKNNAYIEKGWWNGKIIF